MSNRYMVPQLAKRQVHLFGEDADRLYLTAASTGMTQGEVVAFLLWAHGQELIDNRRRYLQAAEEGMFRPTAIKLVEVVEGTG